MAATAEPPLKRARATSGPARFCWVCMGSKKGKNPSYLAAARRLGSLLAEQGLGLVYGGAKEGLMGAVADGVLEHEDGYVVGVFPEGDLVPLENRHPRLSESITVRTMAERKKVMVDRADVVVALPGGPGTLEEITEVVNSIRLGHHQKAVFVLNVDGFWGPFIDMYKKMELAGFLKEGDSADLFQLVNSPDELIVHDQFLPAAVTGGKATFIDKLALVFVRDRKQLVARTRGKQVFFTPGGKREAGETDEEALVREIKEELSVDLVKASIQPYGVFQAQAFGKPEGTMVRMTCYTAEYVGTLTPSNEIEELRWITSKEPKELLSVTGVMILDDLKAKDRVD